MRWGGDDACGIDGMHLRGGSHRIELICSVTRSRIDSGIHSHWKTPFKAIGQSVKKREQRPSLSVSLP